MEKYSTRLDATNFPKKKLIMELQTMENLNQQFKQKGNCGLTAEQRRKERKIITNR